MAIDTLPLDLGRDKPFYVYLYRDPRPRKRLAPIYVGKGKAKTGRADIHWRLRTHNTLLAAILRKIADAGLEPIVEIIGWFDDDDTAYQCERALIAKFGRRWNKTGTLANISDGGDGGYGVKHSPEAIEKTRRAHIGAKRSDEARERMRAAWTDERRAAHIARKKGQKISDWQKQRLSECRKGKPISAEHRAAISAGLKGHKQTEEAKRNSGAGISRSWTPERRAAQAERVRERQKGVFKTHCHKGHEMAGNNLYIKPNGNRGCRACHREYARLRRCAASKS
jgi:hypothetical protein